MANPLKIFFLFLFTGLAAISYSQKTYRYSAADKLALANANKKAAKMNDTTLSEKQAYAAGMEYQRIYNKYKDTSMKWAVRCFEYYCWEENEYVFTAQQKAVAYNLGQIYEKGKGTKADTMMAITWYHLSTATGIAKGKALAKIICGRTLVLESAGEKMQPEQVRRMLHSGATISLATLPTCKYDKNQIAKMAEPIAEFMKERPDLLLRIEYNTSSMWNSTHSLNVRQNALLVIDQLSAYLVDKVGISAERVKKPLMEGNATIFKGKGLSYIEFTPVTYEEFNSNQ
jgi:hypothetical protein